MVTGIHPLITQLVQARKARGLSQQALASLLGVTQTAVSYWEAGQRDVSFSQLVAWANVLNVPIGGPPTKPPATPEPVPPLRTGTKPPRQTIYDATERMIAVGVTPADAAWLVQQLSIAEAAQAAGKKARDEQYAFVDEHLGWHEVDSARDGWHEGSCDLCDWTTSGTEDAVEEAAHEHAVDHLSGLVDARQEAARAAAPGLRVYALAHRWVNDMPANITEDVARAVLADAGRQILAAYDSTDTTGKEPH